MPIGVSAAPRQWNLWDLERLTREASGGDAILDEERTFLLMYLREFAGPDGALPIDFDGLVRDSFGELVGRAVTAFAGLRAAALAGVALLGIAIALAVAHRSAHKADTLPSPAGQWYTALAAPYTSSTKPKKSACGVVIGADDRGSRAPGAAVRREDLHRVRRQARC